LSCVVTLGRKKLPGLGALTYAMFSLSVYILKDPTGREGNWNLNIQDCMLLLKLNRHIWWHYEINQRAFAIPEIDGMVVYTLLFRILYAPWSSYALGIRDRILQNRRQLRAIWKNNVVHLNCQLFVLRRWYPPKVAKKCQETTVVSSRLLLK
jgi:hypothetical protein